MNRKGFTLVELLAVIIILALLALITTTSITKLVSDAKNDLSDTQIKLIESAAKMWGAENIMELPNDGECIYITVEDLQSNGFIDSKIIDPKTSSEIKDLKIKISAIKGKHENIVRTYEVNPDSVKGCKWIYQPKCTAKSIASSGSYIKGDLYSCVVSSAESYDFYVLSDNNDGTVTLLMSENLDGTTSWNNKNKFLEDKTSEWTLTDDISIPSVTQLGCTSEDPENEKYCEHTIPSWENGIYWTSSVSYIMNNKWLLLIESHALDGDWCAVDACKNVSQDCIPDDKCYPQLYSVRPTITVEKDKLIQ